jgi:hypothetical protein
MEEKIESFKDHPFMIEWVDHIKRMHDRLQPKFDGMIERNKEQKNFVKDLKKVKNSLEKMVRIIG